MLRLPSPSRNVDETKPFTKDKLVQLIKDEGSGNLVESFKIEDETEILRKSRATKLAPAVAL